MHFLPPRDRVFISERKSASSKTDFRDSFAPNSSCTAERKRKKKKKALSLSDPIHAGLYRLQLSRWLISRNVECVIMHTQRTTKCRRYLACALGFILVACRAKWWVALYRAPVYQPRAIGLISRYTYTRCLTKPDLSCARYEHPRSAIPIPRSAHLRVANTRTYLFFQFALLKEKKERYYLSNIDAYFPNSCAKKSFVI